MGSANLGSQDSSMGGSALVDHQVDSSKDTVFMILRSSRRRLLLHYLEQSGGTRSRGELARYIAAAEEGIEMEQVTTTDRKRVYVSLHQTHLPTMDDVGIIDYDEDRGTVELREENAQKYYRYLHFDPSEVSSDGEGTEQSRPDRSGRSEEADVADTETERDSTGTPASNDTRSEHPDEERPNGMVESLFSMFKTTR